MATEEALTLDGLALHGAASGGYSAAVLADSPLLYWRLGESSGTNANDETANNRDGTYAAGVTLGTAGALTGDSDKAVTLDGTANGKVTSSYNPFTGQRTFEGWAWRDSGAASDYIFGGTGANPPVFGLGDVNNDIYWFPDVGTGSVLWAGAWPGNAQWVHWVLTYDAASKGAELFINGVSKGTRTTAAAYGADPGNFKIGNYGSGDSQPFLGRQDEAAIYSGILSSARVTAHYTAGTTASANAPFTLEAFDHKPAKKLLEWVKGADSDGAKLLRPPKHETAEITLKLRVDQQTTMNAALDALGQIVDKLQEAERVSAGGLGRGLELVWVPADSTYTASFYVLAGEVEDIPKEWGSEAGWFVRAPLITIKLTCAPFVYGAEVTTSTTTSSLPLFTHTVASVPGDVPAEARIVVTDAATQSRDFVAAGLEQFYYNPATSLLIDSAAFVVSGFAGTVTTRTGGYSADGVVRATLTTSPVAVCSSAELTTIGTWRNFFRLFPSTTNVSVRLAWRQGRDQWTTEPWVQAPFADWWEVDLGQTKIRPALLGTQTWQWRIEAKSTVAGDTIDVDYHALVPSAEGFAKARRPAVYETPVTISARDEFDQTAGVLTGKVAPVGGTWAGAGDADDFSVDSGLKNLKRTFTSDAAGSEKDGRFGVLGTATFTAVAVQTDFKTSGTTAVYQGVVARYTDINNWLLGRVALGNGVATAAITKCVAGTVSQIQNPSIPLWDTNSWRTLRLVVEASGRAYLWFFPQGGAAGSPLVGSDPVLATGGALATGKVGLFDYAITATGTDRYYDNFSAFVPTLDAAVNASQSLEFRCYGDDPALREDSTGTYWGRPAETRGGRIWLPPKGDDNRTSRLAVFARRNDIEELPSSNIADSTQVAVVYRPRWVAFPRQA